MKTLIKVGTTIGMVIVVLYIIGMAATAFVNIIIGLSMALFGGCVLLACWAIFQGITHRAALTQNPQSNP